jgi:DNA-binding winged helix-turn-helix (wHTH) protein/tetratricopeptide (TPR) repeat protein
VCRRSSTEIFKTSSKNLRNYQRMSTSLADQGVYAFGPFILDPTRRRLTRAEIPLSLSPKAFDVLLYLLRNPNRVVDKTELLNSVWPGRVIEESNLSQTIFTLRKALNAGGEGESYIVTAPGYGYRFAAPVSVLAYAPKVRPENLVAANAPEVDSVVRLGSARPSDSRASTPASKKARLPDRRWWLGAVALIVAAILFAALWRYERSMSNATGEVRPNIVVLADFHNQTNDASFDRVLGKVLEVDLVQSPMLSVLARQQVQKTLNLMTKPDAELTASVAQEVCVRNDGNAVIDGSIATLDVGYLLTLTAIDCVSGRILSDEKARADNKTQAIVVLDSLASKVRAKLGESPQSIADFNVPILQRKTASFDALKAYSEAVYLNDHGKRVESISLFRRAVELDPEFAMAYADLSSVYYSLGQDKLAIESVTRAYSLRDTVSEREKLLITARYHQNVTKDLIETRRILVEWTEMYPHDAIAWIKLLNAENWMGHYEDAIVAGTHAMSLDPQSGEGEYVVLAWANEHVGNYAKSKQLCEQAIAKGFDSENTHATLMDLAFLNHDDAGVDAQLQWAKGKSGEHYLLYYAALLAYAHGQIRRGDEQIARMVELGKAQGFSESDALSTFAEELVDLGFDERSRKLLESLPADDADSADYRFAVAEVGDKDRAESLLAKDLQESPSDTLLAKVYGPEMHAAIALRQGHPADAIADMAPALPYESRNYEVPYLLGRAYLAAGDASRAANEFRKIVDHPGIEPYSVQYDLALLGLARAESTVGDIAASRSAYEKFLTEWKDADHDIPPLQQAREQYAAITGLR